MGDDLPAGEKALRLIFFKGRFDRRSSAERAHESLRLLRRLGDAHPAMRTGNESAVAEQRDAAEGKGRALQVIDRLEKEALRLVHHFQKLRRKGLFRRLSRRLENIAPDQRRRNAVLPDPTRL